MNHTEWDDLKAGDYVETDYQVSYKDYVVRGVICSVDAERICIKDANKFYRNGQVETVYGGSCGKQAHLSGQWLVIKREFAPEEYIVRMPKGVEGQVFPQFAQYPFMKGIKMNRLTPAIKRTMSADNQTLYRAGFISSCGEITETGARALQNIQWAANMKQLIVSANDALDEEAACRESCDCE